MSKITRFAGFYGKVKNTFFIVVIILSLCSCIDKDKFNFNYESAKELYETTFPVKDIDAVHDWKTVSLVSMNVSVYDDEQETYKIKVYDRFPFNPEDFPKRLAMDSVENGKTIKMQFDCPSALDTLWVVSVDAKRRRAAKAVAVQDRKTPADVVFGTVEDASRASGDGSGIERLNAPYTEPEIESMLGFALEVESGKAIGADYGQVSPTDKYKLTKDGDKYDFVYNGGSRNSILIVTTEWTPKNSVNVNGSNLTIIIANGGKFKGSMSLIGNSNLYVMNGGSIESGDIFITNSKNDRYFYNGGDITLNSLRIEGSDAMFYNAGDMSVNEYSASNEGATLTNFGDCHIARMNAVLSNINNACFMKVDEDCSAKRLVIGDGAALECKTFNEKQWGDMTVFVGKNSMIDCKENMRPNLKIRGSGNKNSLFKIGIVDFVWTMNSAFYAYDIQFMVKNVLHSWIPLSNICRDGATIRFWGESNIYIPKDKCTGDGNDVGDGEDIDDELSPTYTYCYEDYYPIPGDYDFNDVVMDVNYQLLKYDNKIEGVKVRVQLTAVGATYQIGTALQLVGIDKSNIDRVYVENGDVSFGKMFSSYEDETSLGEYAVIPLFNDAHHAISGATDRYMYNTSKGHEGYADAKPREITVILSFVNPVMTFGLDNLDLFIARPLVNGYYDGQKDRTRVEIHLYEFWNNRTKKAVDFAANEAAAGNRTWAICVPDFNYPYEQVPIYRISGTETGSTIDCAYPKFQEWASNRNKAKDWYKSPNPNSTYRNVQK